MTLISQKEAADFAKSGAREFRYNADIRVTPGGGGASRAWELSLKNIRDFAQAAPVRRSMGDR